MNFAGKRKESGCMSDLMEDGDGIKMDIKYVVCSVLKSLVRILRIHWWALGGNSN